MTRSFSLSKIPYLNQTSFEVQKSLTDACFSLAQQNALLQKEATKLRQLIKAQQRKQFINQKLISRTDIQPKDQQMISKKCLLPQSPQAALCATPSTTCKTSRSKNNPEAKQANIRTTPFCAAKKYSVGRTGQAQDYSVKQRRRIHSIKYETNKIVNQPTLAISFRPHNCTIVVRDKGALRTEDRVRVELKTGRQF